MSVLNCEWVVRRELAERYLLGQLGDAERLAYEQHFFECSRCADEVEGLQALQEVLSEAAPVGPRAASGSGRTRRWLATAALLAASIAGVVLLVRPDPASHRTAQSADEPAPAGDATPAAARPGRAPVVPSSPATAASPIDDGSQPPAGRDVPAELTARLKRLASVSPPSYSPRVLRGPVDEATAAFRNGMRAYVDGNYAAAVDELKRAARLDPGRPDIAFYLGASQLMVGDTAAAASELQRVIAFGDTPFLGDGHFYLGKAWLARADRSSATRELEIAARLPGERSDEARALLVELQALRTP